MLYFYQLLVEYQQFNSVTAEEYMSGGWNWINILHFITAAYIYVVLLLNNEEILEHQTTYAIRSIAILSLWSNFFDWLRLFDQTSFYIKLVERTFVDIVQFMILFIIALAMIGSAMFALERSYDFGEEPDRIIDNTFDYFFIDFVYNQYMLALGEFAVDGFANHPVSDMCYLLFIFATLFTQVVFLNMLIAIMGNTFAQVMEKKHQYAQATKLSFMADYYDVFNSKKGRKLDLKIYMFIISPLIANEETDSGEGNDDWEGSINYLKKSLQLRLNDVQRKVLDQNSR